MPVVDKKRKPVGREPVWTGPYGSGPNGGVTQGLLNMWLACRERARLKLIEGLVTDEGWDHRTGYGEMWHLCEETHCVKGDWKKVLRSHVKQLCDEHRTQQEQINHWYQVCSVQFPLYQRYWQEHPDNFRKGDKQKRVPILQECAFDIDYPIAPHVSVRLRGKWDGVEVWQPNLTAPGLRLQENKTKADIKENQIKKQLSFDLQTMLYLVALKHDRGNPEGYLAAHTTKKLQLHRMPIQGILYNVVKRPLSGGTGSIRQHKPTKKNPKGETPSAFYARLGGIISESPEQFFMRWRVEVLDEDIAVFETQFLKPALRCLCDWYEWVSSCYREKASPFASSLHWRHPFGTYNSLNDGGTSDLDNYLATGSTLGLKKTSVIFPELT